MACVLVGDASHQNIVSQIPYVAAEFSRRHPWQCLVACAVLQEPRLDSLLKQSVVCMTPVTYANDSWTSTVHSCSQLSQQEAA